MRRAWYWILFAVESAGIVFIFYEGIPFYRRLLRGSAGEQPGAYLITPAVLAIVVLQICYWLMRRLRPPMRSRHRPVIAHLLLFASRLSFIFAGSLVTVVVFVRSQDTHFSAAGLAILLAVTFAQFCYSRELDTLARIFDES